MNSALKSAIRSWETLSNRPDLIGKDVTYRSASYTQSGKIQRIFVEDGFFIIETSEGNISNGKLRFKIDEEREAHPPEGTGTIFCDLDDDSRQIQIEAG